MGLDLEAMARRVRVYRKARGMTRERLASAAGLSVTTLQALEGGRRDPHLSSVVAVSDALGVTIGELLDES